MQAATVPEPEPFQVMEQHHLEAVTPTTMGLMDGVAAASVTVTALIERLFWKTITTRHLSQPIAWLSLRGLLDNQQQHRKQRGEDGERWWWWC